MTKRLGIAALVTADLSVVGELRPHADLLRHVAAPRAWLATAGADRVTVELAAAALWLVAAWLAVGLAASCFAHLPGVLGRCADAVAVVVLPRAVYRLAAGAAGLGVVLAPGLASASPTPPPPSAAFAAFPLTASPTPPPSAFTAFPPSAAFAAFPLAASATSASSAASAAFPLGTSAASAPLTASAASAPPGAPGVASSAAPAWPTDSGPHPPVWPTDSGPHPPVWPTTSAPTSPAPVPSKAPTTPAARSATAPTHPPKPDQHAAHTVVVQPGDSLWRIAEAHLPASAPTRRVAAAWPRWYAANRRVIGDDPSHITPGQLLNAPSEEGSQ